jgi:choline dehydrogenase-like flavoprotein
MSAEKFDVVIIGGGNAGIGVTGPVRRAGLTVAMIEARDLGGTCPNRGCTPKKVLVAAGQALHDIERAAQHRIAVGKPKLDWAALIAREKDMIKDIPENLARGADLRRNGRLVEGHCRSCQRPHSGGALRRPCRPRACQRLQPGHEVRHQRKRAARAHLRLSDLRLRHQAYAWSRLSCIARCYRLDSQPAFPKADGLRDADNTAGQLFGAATSTKEITTCPVTSQTRAGSGKRSES